MKVPPFRNWLTTGVWTPLIPFPFRAIIMFGWVFLPIPYGIDYLSENAERPNRLSFIEDALPLYVWGGAMIFFGGMATISLALRWRMRTIIACHFLGALWFTLAVGLFADAVSHWNGDGYRTSVLFLVVSITYWGASVGYYVQNDGVYEPMIRVKDDDGDYE